MPTNVPTDGDQNKNCPVWARSGECKKNPNYMLVNCIKSCKEFPNGNTADKDYHPNCLMWARRGECKKNPTYMLSNCTKSCRLVGALWKRYVEIPQWYWKHGMRISIPFHFNLIWLVLLPLNSANRKRDGAPNYRCFSINRMGMLPEWECNLQN